MSDCRHRITCRTNKKQRLRFAWPPVAGGSDRHVLSDLIFQRRLIRLGLHTVRRADRIFELGGTKLPENNFFPGGGGGICPPF